MSSRDLFDRIAELPHGPSDVPKVPPPELVAFVVQVGRRLKSWKQATLAGFAGISLSTVERVERGQTVGPDKLDRIAQALGYDAGYFTAPRCRISEEEAVAHLADTYGEMTAVEVGPLHNQHQVRKAAHCHAYLPHCPDLPVEFVAHVEGLIEWLDFCAFELSDFCADPIVRAGKRRRLYNDILGYVRDLESRGLNVLFGVMEAPQPGMSDWKVALLSVTLKAKDPGAPKRKHIFVDRRVVSLRRALVETTQRDSGNFR